MDTLTYVDGFMVLIGIYMIISTIQMKKTGNIPSMVLAKEEHMKVKDKKKFIDMIYRKLLTFSFVMTLLGIGGVVSDKVITIPYFSYIELAVFFIMFFAFMKTYQDARKECIY